MRNAHSSMSLCTVAKARHAASFSALDEAEVEQFLHVVMDALDIPLHAARKLANRNLALPLQRAHDRPTALGHATEEHAWTFKIQHLALV